MDVPFFSFKVFVYFKEKMLHSLNKSKKCLATKFIIIQLEVNNSSKGNIFENKNLWMKIFNVLSFQYSKHLPIYLNYTFNRVPKVYFICVYILSLNLFLLNAGALILRSF